MHLTRRDFLASVAVLGAATGAPRARAATAATPPVCIFSKHLHFIKDYAQLAKTAKALGVDGIDLTVRKGGHVEPANVSIDLPKCVDAVRAEGLDVHMITTDLNKGSDPDAAPILDAASKLKIKYVRVGRLEYSKDGDIAAELAQFTDGLRALTALLEQREMAAGYHNHSGGTNAGAPLWDLYEMIRAIHSDAFGSNFDIGHATVAGGADAWLIGLRLLAPYVKMTSVKDFVWDGPKVKWVPLGQGIVNLPQIFSVLRARDFSGPASIHIEYNVPSNDAMLDEIRAAAVTLRAGLTKAGYQT